MRLPEFRIVVH